MQLLAKVVLSASILRLGASLPEGTETCDAQGGECDETPLLQIQQAKAARVSLHQAQQPFPPPYCSQGVNYDYCVYKDTGCNTASMPGCKADGVHDECRYCGPPANGYGYVHADCPTGAVGSDWSPSEHCPDALVPKTTPPPPTPAPTTPEPTTPEPTTPEPTTPEPTTPEPTTPEPTTPEPTTPEPTTPEPVKLDFRYLKDGETHRCLSYNYGSPVQNMYESSCRQLAKQRFAFTPSGEIVNDVDGLCLGIKHDVTVTNAVWADMTVMEPCSHGRGGNQQWSMDANGKIHSLDLKDNCLGCIRGSVEGSDNDNCIERCDSSPSQLWTWADE